MAMTARIIFEKDIPRIVIFDNQDEGRTNLTGILRRHNLLVYEAYSLSGLIDIIRRQQPDLLVLGDDTFPLDGFQVCEMLKSDDNYRGLHVILLADGITETKLTRSRIVCVDQLVLWPRYDDGEVFSKSIVDYVKNHIVKRRRLTGLH